MINCGRCGDEAPRLGRSEPHLSYCEACGDWVVADSDMDSGPVRPVGGRPCAACRSYARH